MERDASAFIIRYGSAAFPLVTIERGIGGEYVYVYCPRAPQIVLSEEDQGPFMEALARQIKPYLPDETVFVRFDTVWDNPYDTSSNYTEAGCWLGPPRHGVREMRMNYFTREKNLRKSPDDLLPPDTVEIQLHRDEDDLFMDMRQNTRNCIRRSIKKGVTVQNAPLKYLPDWYRLYHDTAKRQGFTAEKLEYFQNLFHSADAFMEKTGDSGIVPSFHLLIATKGKEILSGMILGLYANMSYYLFAGSSPLRRDCMPNYLLQWEAIKMARRASCHRYDLFGIPPNDDPLHPQHGLYTFKKGFGGKVVHNRGCWDYPIDEQMYMMLRNIKAAV
ncbi:MAG: lipid II:glycine glycyltransferase FemX [Spirochaetota bacterium]